MFSLQHHRDASPHSVTQKATNSLKATVRANPPFLSVYLVETQWSTWARYSGLGTSIYGQLGHTKESTLGNVSQL